ncbi:MAG: class I SAM-dependent methyltransferase, partial [Nitrospirota bacterium]|nr:class I SAM-dependent methyltransferase [Nitrospirota bacterium]
KVLNDYSISGFGTGTDAVEEILSIIFQRQFPQVIVRPCNMWDRVVALTVNCELVHGISGISFDSLRPQDLEDIDPTFAQQEGKTRKEEIYAYLKLLRNGMTLGMPLYISGTILQYLGASTESGAMYMLDGARRLSASALHHQKRMSVTLLVFEEEFSKLLQESVKTEIQDRIQHLAWFQNYHSFPFLDVTGQRSLQRFTLMETGLLEGSVIVDFGCNLGQASLKAIQCGAKEVWGIEGMQDTIAVANEIKKIAGCDNLHYLQVDFNDPQFDQKIDEMIPVPCDYAFFFSVYRTKELTQRDKLFRYILQKTTKGIFFEGHAHPKIDTIEYYEWLFDSFNVPYTFLGYSEQQIRPLFYLDLEKRPIQQNIRVPQLNPDLHSLDFRGRLSKQDNLIKSR